jgi:hypothetical protein
MERWSRPACGYTHSFLFEVDGRLRSRGSVLGELLALIGGIKPHASKIAIHSGSKSFLVTGVLVVVYLIENDSLHFAETWVSFDSTSLVRTPGMSLSRSIQVAQTSQSAGDGRPQHLNGICAHIVISAWWHQYISRMNNGEASTASQRQCQAMLILCPMALAHSVSEGLSDKYQIEIQLNSADPPDRELQHSYSFLHPSSILSFPIHLFKRPNPRRALPDSIRGKSDFLP